MHFYIRKHEGSFFLKRDTPHPSTLWGLRRVRTHLLASFLFLEARHSPAINLVGASGGYERVCLLFSMKLKVFYT